MKLKSHGDWILQNIAAIESSLKKLPKAKKISWDVSGVDRFDSAGIVLFIKYSKSLSSMSELNMIGYTSEQKSLYDFLTHSKQSKYTKRKDSYLEKLGKSTTEVFLDINNFISFLGHVVIAILSLFIKPKNIRFKETIYHMQKSGINAILIVGMTAFLVGMVIAYQGSVQLAKFGADIFIVDTVGISITRELGPMITAIVIAGRSGSAYTAEIGAMKITDEISAMKTMGFDPFYFLVLPRIFALMLVLPLLVFFADIVGIFGGLVASYMQLNIPAAQFLDRLHEALELKHYFLGLIKTPIFAFFIAIIGCYKGFSVSHNTESLGLNTTSSVVIGIFMVIAIDALFSVLFTKFGL